MNEADSMLDQTQDPRAPRGFDDALAPAVLLARSSRDRARQALARELETAGRLRTAYAHASDALQAEADAARAADAVGFDPRQRERHLTWLIELDRRVRAAAKAASVQQAAVSLARKTCLDAEMRLEALLRHRATTIDAFLAAQARADQSAADDAWTVRSHWAATREDGGVR